MAKTSPTQRSLKYMRDNGYFAQVVERWNPYAKVRVDLFGGIDLVCVAPGQIIGVQATSATNHSARVAKLRAEPKLRAWVEAGGILEVQSWGLKGAKGERKRWACRRERVEFFTEPVTLKGSE